MIKQGLASMISSYHENVFPFSQYFIVCNEKHSNMVILNVKLVFLENILFRLIFNHILMDNTLIIHFIYAFLFKDVLW